MDGRISFKAKLWKEVHEQLEGVTRYKLVYAKLASELTKAGLNKSGEWCRSKVEKLRQDLICA